MDDGCSRGITRAVRPWICTRNETRTYSPKKLAEGAKKAVSQKEAPSCTHRLSQKPGANHDCTPPHFLGPASTASNIQNPNKGQLTIQVKHIKRLGFRFASFSVDLGRKRTRHSNNTFCPGCFLGVPFTSPSGCWFSYTSIPFVIIHGPMGPGQMITGIGHPQMGSILNSRVTHSPKGWNLCC